MNDKLIQIGGKSYKECEVVMLSTKEQRWKIGNEHVDRYEFYSFVDKKLYSRQSNAYNWSLSHLYILSSEEIKEGDWVYHPEVSQEYTIVDIRKQGDDKYSKGMYPAQGVFQWKNTTNEWYKKCKKIIATTDESLTVDCDKIITNCDKSGYNGRSICSNCKGSAKLPLPRTSDDFIKAFVKAQGKGFDKVLVEYQEIQKCLYEYPKACENSECRVLNKCREEERLQTSYYKLKVSPDNTITIRAVEEEKTSWNREEVVKLMDLAYSEGNSNADMPTEHWEQFHKDKNKWIEKNL